MGFDEYQKSDNAMCMNNDYNRKIYEAGAVSRQGEVDELQKRIDKVIAFQKKLQNSEKLDWMCIGDELEAILNEST